jgi:hypothetical protein
MTLTGQNASANLARATTLANDGYLRRDHLRLERGCELLGLRKPKPEVGQASLLIALEARDLHLRHQATAEELGAGTMLRSGQAPQILGVIA